jgi:hypothetical protein
VSCCCWLLPVPHSRRPSIIITTVITAAPSPQTGEPRSERRPSGDGRRGRYVTVFTSLPANCIPVFLRSCYILAMKKSALTFVLVTALAVPAFAFGHKVNHPKPVHPTNPYLKHPNHKAQRHHHKKI